MSERTFKPTGGASATINDSVEAMREKNRTAVQNNRDQHRQNEIIRSFSSFSMT